jgi:hypothetical protein
MMAMLLLFSTLTRRFYEKQIIMNNYFFLFLLAMSVNVLSQDMPQQLIASTGDHHSNASASVSWTVGETVIATLTNSSIHLTQGFQQGNLTVSNLVEQDMLDFNLKVYPNPVIEILILETDEKQHSYRVINMQGELVLNGIITAVLQEIDFTNLPRGVYLLSVDQKQTHKIIKQ